MMIIGCDFHPSWQQVSWLDSETGEAGEQKLVHASGDARRFYQALAAPGLIGMEATGNSQWFIELVQDLDWGCGPDPRQLCAQAEDGQARRGTYSEAGVVSINPEGVGHPPNKRNMLPAHTRW